MGYKKNNRLHYAFESCQLELNPSMKAIKSMLLVSAIAFSALLITTLSARAQTTNFVINAFDTDEVTPIDGGWPFDFTLHQGWGNWFGGGENIEWDSTMDASNNPSSGSMKVTMLWPPSGFAQISPYDGFFSFTVNAQQFTNLQFDIRFDPSSPTRTNGDGTVDYGFMQVGTYTNGYGQDYFGGPNNGFAVPVTNVGWTRINIPLDVVADPWLTNITDIVFHNLNTYYGNTPYSGTQIYWVDNIQFVGSAGLNTNPPPRILNFQKTAPGLRLFASTANIGPYDRQMFVTTNGDASWVGKSGPVTYSFNISSFPNLACSNFQFHMFLIPANGMDQYGPYNSFQDYNCSNDIFLQIVNDPNLSSTNYTVHFNWKTNHPAANSTATPATVLTPTVVGTWNITFNNNTNVSITGPGTSTNFTIPANVAAQFADPVYAYFGIQANTSDNFGQWAQLSQVTMTGTTGAESENFTTKTNWNSSGIWAWAGADFNGALWVVSTNSAYWLDWALPDSGFGLATKSSLSHAIPWASPGSFNIVGDVPDIRTLTAPKQKWALVPKDCLPSSTNAFFVLVNPPAP